MISKSIDPVKKSCETARDRKNKKKSKQFDG